MAYRATANEIDDYASYLTGVAFQLAMINSTIADQGCNTAGFTGVLDPLDGVCNGIREHVNQAFADLQSKLLNTMEGMQTTAREYRDGEQRSHETIRAAGDQAEP